MSGFLTPENVPNGQWFVRHITLPADPQWCAVFDGLLLELTYAYNWQTQGAQTPQYMADWFWSHYAEFTTNHSEAPDYSSADDVDGQPVQPWYEALEDWIIAGFLAVTFTPNAALVYQATVPKIRIALRTGNLGALFRVLINGVEAWTGDSYAPITDFLTHDFDLSGYTLPVEVRVEHNGVGPNIIGETAKLEYVRGDQVAAMVATILRADPEGCGVQWSTDDGGTWNTVDLAACISSIATQDAIQAIQDAINSGQIQGGTGQQGPAAPPVAGSCVTYHVHLEGNNRWLCPSPVSVDDTIQILNERGAWWDGDNLSTAWYCPTGQRWLLVDCSDIGAHTDSSDPLNTVNHMRLVGNIASTWFDALTTYTVPSGIENQPLYLQANDSTIGDNQGSLDFDVQVCVGGWSHDFDFTLSDGGWELNHGSSQFGAYSAGVGWIATTEGPYKNVFIGHDISATVITKVDMLVNRSIAESSAAKDFIVYDSGLLLGSSTLPSGEQHVVWEGSQSCTRLILGVNLDTNTGATGVIVSVHIEGSGSDPF